MLFRKGELTTVAVSTKAAIGSQGVRGSDKQYEVHLAGATRFD
jgi:hypothetical protein